MTNDVRRLHHDKNLARRALAAYFRTGGDEQTSTADVVEHEGLNYVVLSSATSTLAVYRIRNDGVLRRMRRWPPAIENVSATTNEGIA